MTVPFQRRDALSLWSLEDKLFIHGALFDPAQFSGLFAGGSTYLVLGLAFDGATGGKVVPTGSGTASACAAVEAIGPSPFFGACSGKGPPPPPGGAPSVTSPISLIADFSTLTFDGGNIWVPDPLNGPYGPVGVYPDSDTAMAGVAATGPIGQLFWLFRVTSVGIWAGGTNGAAPTLTTQVAPIIDVPFYLTIPINW